MRLLNTALWVGIVLLLGCCVNLDAQYNGLTAQRYTESASSDVDSQPIVNGDEFTSSVTAGEIVIGGLCWANNPAGDVVIKNSSGTTISHTASFSGVTGQRCEIFYDTAPSTGTYWVQSQTDFGALAEQYGIVMHHFPPTTTTATPDGSQLTTSAVQSGGAAATLTLSPTTTDNGEIVFAISSNAGGSGSPGAPVWPSQLVGFAQTIGALGSFRSCGAAGSCSITHQSDVNNSGIGMNAVAFLAPAQAIATTTLHDCALTVAYSDTVTDIGGTGSPTWSISAGSLPTGLSINASTGAITGTCSGAVGTTTFTVSDGVATKSLSIATRASFAAISVNGKGNASTTSPTSSFAVTAGHTIALFVVGWDSAQSSYVQASTFGDNLGCGDVYTRAEGIPGMHLAGIQIYTTSACASSPSAQVTWTNSNTFGGSPLQVFAMDVGAQAVLDGVAGCSQWVFASSGTCVTGNFNAAVANELLVAVGGWSHSSNETMTINSPFASLYTNSVSIVQGGIVVATQQVTTAGNYTATGTMSGSNGFYGAAVALVGFRPQFEVAAPVTFLGEKRRRRIY